MGLLKNFVEKITSRDPHIARSALHILLLDDDVRRHEWFQTRFKNDVIDLAEDVATARKFLSERIYDAIFLDHDLLPEHYKTREPDDERTGYAIALYLAENPQVQPGATIISHTLNDVGALRIVTRLKEGGRHAEYVPFTMLDFKIRHYWKR